LTEALLLKELTRTFGTRRAVDRLNLRVEAGDCYGFLGPNGAGKTTTLRMILGLVRPSEGEIIVFGERHPIARRHHLGAVIEHADFHSFLSGRANLEVLAAYDHGVKAADIDRALERVGLRDRQHDHYGTYSLGMKQRLGIAQALMRGPKLLLLDEPTNGLDPAGIKSMRDLIAELRHVDGLTVFLSSHLMHEVEMLCNRVGFLHRGVLLKEGDKSELLGAKAAAYHELRGASADKVRPIVDNMAGCTPVGVAPDGSLRVVFEEGIKPSTLLAACEAAGLDRVEIQTERYTLEDLFLEVTGVQADGQVG